MTILMNTHERPSRSSAGDAVNTGAADKHGGMFRQFCLGALAALGAGAILAGIIALETAFYLRTLLD